MRPAEFTIGFEDLVSGWVTVRVQVGPATERFLVSDVPNDPLFDLADTMYAVIDNTHPISFAWCCEPTELQFTFTPAEDRVELVLEHWPDRRRGEREGRVVIKRRFWPVDLAGRLWRALRALEGRWAAEGLGAEWGRPFPSEAVARLGNRLGGNDQPHN